MSDLVQKEDEWGATPGGAENTWGAPAAESVDNTWRDGGHDTTDPAGANNEWDDGNIGAGNFDEPGAFHTTENGGDGANRQGGGDRGGFKCGKLGYVVQRTIIIRPANVSLLAT